jgi:hypothetical protein
LKKSAFGRELFAFPPDDGMGRGRGEVRPVNPSSPHGHKKAQKITRMEAGVNHEKLKYSNSLPPTQIQALGKGNKKFCHKERKDHIDKSLYFLPFRVFIPSAVGAASSPNGREKKSYLPLLKRWGETLSNPDILNRDGVRLSLTLPTSP